MSTEILSLIVAALAVVVGPSVSYWLGVRRFAHERELDGRADARSTLAQGDHRRRRARPRAAGGIALAARSGRSGRPGAADLWPEPRVSGPVPSGSVRVSLIYRVLPADAPAFIARMEELRQLRLHDGAVDWVLERDLADPDRLVESFHVRSWQEHLRQHERLTQADLALENEIRELGAGGGAAARRALGRSRRARVPEPITEGYPRSVDTWGRRCRGEWASGQALEKTSLSRTAPGVSRRGRASWVVRGGSPGRNRRRSPRAW